MKETLIISGALLLIASAIDGFNWYQFLVAFILFVGGILYKNSFDKHQ